MTAKKRAKYGSLKIFKERYELIFSRPLSENTLKSWSSGRRNCKMLDEFKERLDKMDTQTRIKITEKA